MPMPDDTSIMACMYLRFDESLTAHNLSVFSMLVLVTVDHDTSIEEGE